MDNAIHHIFPLFLKVAHRLITLKSRLMDEKQLEQYLEEVYRLEEEILGEYDED